MANDWTDVRAAVELNASTYSAYIKGREDTRGGSNAQRLLEDSWLDALEGRRLALDAMWTPADGVWQGIDGVDNHRLGTTLQRYYAETEPIRKAEAEAKKKAAKEAK